MNRSGKILSLVLFFIMIYVIPLMAVSDDSYIEELDSTKSVAIGAIFYAKETRVPGYRAQYTHMGFEGGDLRIKYELIYHTDEIEEVEYYTLRLNGKDALLATKPLFGEDPNQVRKLLISVVDGFGRVRVQEFRGN